MSIKHLYYRTTENIKNHLMYPVYLYQNCDTDAGKHLMRFSYHGVKFHGQPRNHNFKVYNKKLYPSFQLFERWDSIAQLIPSNARSLIDLSCCRGFYVLQSILQSNIERAVGIDIDEEYLKEANQARSLTRVKSAAFHRGTLENILTDSTIGKTEYDVVLLTGAYHHLFWGSNRSKQAYRNHDDILSRLAQVCGDTLIISACFDVQQLPHTMRDQAMTSSDAKKYTLCHFLEAAEHWFYVTQSGMLGEYPLYTLKKKNLHTTQEIPVEALELNDAIKYMYG